MKRFLFAATATAAVLLSTNAFALKVLGEKVVQLESLDDYATCQAKSYSGQWCHEALKDWVKAHPKDAFKAGKLTRASMNHWVAVPFFAQAFDKKAGQCQDEDVSMALASAFALPADKEFSPVIQQAKTITFTHCLKDMQDQLGGWASSGSYEKANLCPELSKRGLTANACK
jgi:hypothetical protein